MGLNQQAPDVFARWYDELPSHSSSGGPARGTIAAALVVLERLKIDYDLDLDSHRAAGGSQIKGASGSAVADILSRFGESRTFLREGGRTNRGAPGDIGTMLRALAPLGLDTLSQDERSQILSDLQGFLVDRVRDFHSRQRIKVVYDPSRSTWQSIYDLMTLARASGKEGPVAQYLVGAKLQLRYPDLEVGNESYSTADEQLGRPGDFYLGDTAFHVTVEPMPALYEKCKQNVDRGYRVYLLVSDRRLIGARQNAEAVLAGRIAVESIESFVSQNVEEMASFAKDKLQWSFRHLLETYNSRVDATEIDKSMMVDLPQNLLNS